MAIRGYIGDPAPKGPTPTQVKVANRELKKLRPAKSRNYRDASEVPVPTAVAIIETLPTVQKPSVRSVFGQVGVGETARKPAHRLSPRQGRRLRRRGVQVVQQAMNVLRAEQARRAAKAREEAMTAPVKEQCNARTKLGLRCRKTAVADGYCATHGG